MDFQEGWRRLAVVVLVAWEGYWIYGWSVDHADALTELGRELGYAQRDADHDITMMIWPPVGVAIAFLALRWIKSGMKP